MASLWGSSTTSSTTTTVVASAKSQHVLAPTSATIGYQVVPLVNKLQDIFAQLGSSSATIDLPQVAVVGSQSSGKSSVLEALVGRDFLPRGTDICTRRPLLLQLVQTQRKGDGPDVEWGEFLHLPGKRIFDFGAIRQEIEAETDREVGSNKGISEKQIRLKIFSPNVLNITLVDLPGLTKVPVGDQPVDIEAQVRTMIMNYIKHETCIILAVSPANSDLANSDALQLARAADPDGSRTIGVISKLDIMDRGTDARNFLLGNVISLRLGYIGVVNRSQEDIINNRSIRDALSAEEAFFRSKPVYHSLADRCGVPQLAKKLNQILVQHIKQFLPDFKARINAQVVTLQKELTSYGEPTNTKVGQDVLLLNVITKYTKAFQAIVEGKSDDWSTSELSGGARIHYIFQNIYCKRLEDVDPCDDLSDEEIRTAIQNATGPKNGLFVPEVPFEMLVKKQIERLLEPSLQCARFVYDELVKISHQCEGAEVQRFPQLRRKIEEVMSFFLREGLDPAEKMIRNLVEMEMGYINTAHPSFLGGSRAVEEAMAMQRQSKEEGALREAEKAAEKSKGRTLLSRNTNTQERRRGSAEGDRMQEKAETSAPSSWGISAIFGGGDKDNKADSGNPKSMLYTDALPPADTTTLIMLKEPPSVLRANTKPTDQEAVEIFVTRLLLKSYYDIVRKNVQDMVPKAVMHFLVNRSKRDLHNVFISKLYREELLGEMLQEKEEIAEKRRRCKETLDVLQQAAFTLEELPFDYSGGPSREDSISVSTQRLSIKS